MSEYQHLILKANRSIGSHLAQEAFVPERTLSVAYEKFQESLRSGTGGNPGLLKTLVNDMREIDETLLISHAMEIGGIPYIPLRNFEGDKSWVTGRRLELCRATWSVPFDLLEGAPFVATAYYLSTTVRRRWQEEFEEPIHWFVARLSDIEKTLSRLEKLVPVAV